jgi:glycosyltransferase involved in cell wall biosynthesis
MIKTRDLMEQPRWCVIGSGWRFTSGISYYTCRLATSLSVGHPVSVVLMRRLIPGFLYPGRARVGTAMNTIDYPSDVPVFNGVDWFWLPSLFRAVGFLRRERPDAVSLQWWTGAVLHSYLVLVVVARSLGARVIVEFHETQDTGESRIPLASRYLRLVGREVLKRCQGAVVHSEFDRQEVLDHFDLPDIPIHVAPHGPYDHHLTPSGSTTPTAKGDMNVLFFGTIRPYKGLEHLVAAFDSLSDDEVVGLRLTIVGETWEGWTRPVAAALSSRHRDRITVVNRYVHDEEVGRFFADADAAALPYTRSSASGPLHIAMAAGIPVIVTDVGGLRAAAEDYEGAIWVQPADVDGLRQALLSLAEHRGRRYEDPRSWDDTVVVYDRLLQEIEARCA